MGDLSGRYAALTERLVESVLTRTGHTASELRRATLARAARLVLTQVVRTSLRRSPPTSTRSPSTRTPSPTLMSSPYNAPAIRTTPCSKSRSPPRSVPPWAGSNADSPRCGARSRTDAAPRSGAPSSPAAAAQAHAHPPGEWASRAGRRQDVALSAGILRPPDVRLDPGGDARAVGVERRRAGAVRRVHIAPEPMFVLNGCPRRGRVAGPQRREAGGGGAGRLAHGAGRSEGPGHPRFSREAHARPSGRAAGRSAAAPCRRRERCGCRGRDPGLRALQHL